MSCSLNSLLGMRKKEYIGTLVGVIEGDSRSSDYSSYLNGGSSPQAPSFASHLSHFRASGSDRRGVQRNA